VTSDEHRRTAVSPDILDLAKFRADSILDYFTNSSPNFINYKGQSINGPQQVEALAQAQSIGACDQRG
jgi:sodium/potassium-transporting ATPase subunit alpha